MTEPGAAPARVLAWRRDDESDGHSLARLERTADGWLAHGVEVLVGEDDLLSCWFSVDLDPGWTTREVHVRAVDAAGERTLHLRADADRRWWRDGERAPELDGCADVDVAATPLTNTFPVNRLQALPTGEAATAGVAWVDVPALGVTRVDQTYRRLGERRWEYSDPDHGAFVLTVDEDGLVEDYEGFAARVRG